MTPNTRTASAPEEAHLACRSRTGMGCAIAGGGGLLFAAAASCAADVPVGGAMVRPFPFAQVFTFLILMLGPFKIIAPFARITKGADARLTRRVAVQAALFAVAALLVAAFLGETIIARYGIPVPVLALSAGIILFLVALKSVLEQFEPPEARDEPTAPAAVPDLKAALTPLAFPAIVTPYGIAALVVFLAMSQSLQGRLAVGAIVVFIMLLNVLTMLVTRRLLPVLALLLPILGAVLGVVQVALGLQIINNSLRALGVL